MSAIKIPTQITKEMLNEYVSDYVKTNMPERIYEFALSYMLEDLAEQAEANEVNEMNALPEMSEDEDDDDDVNVWVGVRVCYNLFLFKWATNQALSFRQCMIY